MTKQNLIHGIWFDSDGTLVDSLPAHVLFLNDLNGEFHLGLDLPSPEDREGMSRISSTPMRAFFLSAGFPESEVDRFLDIYKTIFPTDPKYASKPFRGVGKLLQYLKKSRVSPVGIITSNYKENVERDLGRNMRFFKVGFDKEYLDKHCGGDKGIALNHRLLTFDNPPPYPYFYVGDTEKDYQAAQFSGMSFIGVSYGWEIKSDDQRFPVARSPRELTDLIRRANEIGFKRQKPTGRLVIYE
ncbi:MAG: HAD hydrolase-like protein [Candidatus Pacearchaeota archaeon]|jgi:phosphoglycolate phosphatase-like HAD superfamily hydrolase